MYPSSGTESTAASSSNLSPEELARERNSSKMGVKSSLVHMLDHFLRLDLETYVLTEYQSPKDSNLRGLICFLQWFLRIFFLLAFAFCVLNTVVFVSLRNRGYDTHAHTYTW